MTFRLYESAWVVVEGVEQPLQVYRNLLNRAAFDVGGFQYDIDARALRLDGVTPQILSILSLEAVRDAGLRSDYGRDTDAEPRRPLSGS